MYTPRLNAMHEESELRALVTATRTGWLVTAGADGLPEATLLPVVWRESTVVAHMARANRH